MDSISRAFTLGEREKHVKRQPPHRRGRVEGLGDGDERHIGRIEDLDDLGEVEKGAGQTVDLIDHHHVDQSFADVAEQRLQGRSFHRAAGEAAIIIRSGKHFPAFVLLAADIGFTGLALGMKRVEGLLEPLFR